MGPLFLAVVLITGSINVLAIDYISVGSGKTCERNGAIVVYDHISTRFECFSGFQTSTSNTDVAVIRRGTEIRKSKYSTVTGSEEAKCADNYVMVGWEKDKIVCRQMIGIKTDGCDYSSRFYRPTSTYGNFGMWYVGKNYRQIVNGFKITHYKAKVLVGVYICKVCSEHAKWTPWSSWGSCSRYCKEEMRGTYFGTRSKTRSCNSQNNIRVVCQANKCPGENRQPDSNKCCPARIDGGWSCWSGWSKCSATCGVGTRTRQRHCNNPSPTKYGYCVGNAIETKKCTTMQFKVVGNVGIPGHNKKTLLNKTPFECMDACLKETSFTCKSFEYQPSQSKCVLSDVDRKTSGVQLSTDASFYGWLYQEKTCGKNEATSIVVPPHVPFEDECHTSNCYAACGEPAYGNEIRSGSDIIVRGLNVDLYAVLKDGTIPQSPTKVTVHAQTVTLTRTLEINYDLVIVARQVYFSGSAQVRHVGKQDALTKCVTQTLDVGCEGMKMTLRSYHGAGRMHIFAQGIKIGHTCTSGRLIQYLPKQDIQALRQAVACSQILRLRSKTGYDKIAKNILDHVKLVSQDSSFFSSASEATSLGALTSEFINEMLIKQRLGQRYLPILSQTAYTYILGKYSHIFNAYNQKYTTAFDADATTNKRLASIDAMLKQAEAAVKLQKRKAANAKQAMSESTQTMQKLNKQFDESNRQLKKAKKKLDEGIEAYKQKKIRESVFNFFNVIAQFVVAIATIVVGAVTGNPALVVAGVGGLISAIAELAKLIQDTIALANAIKSLASMSDEMGSFTATLKAPSKAKKMLQSIDEAAKSRVKIVVWQKMKNMADTRLASGTITEIGGSSEFRKALADTANWGEALSKQVLAHGDLMRAYILESLALEVAENHKQKMDDLYASAKKQNKVSNELLVEVSAELSILQIAGAKTMIDYCQTYYYSTFKPCSSDHIFKLSDRLHTLQLKIQQMANEELYSSRTFGGNPPRPFVDAFILKDQKTTGCPDPALCPITQLKLHRKLQFRIPVTDLAAHERVRVDEMRIFLYGVTFPGKRTSVSVQLIKSGIMEDRYQGQTYTFAGKGRQLRFTFNYHSHTTTDYACKHSSFSDMLFQLTPFGDWAMQILNLESEVDLSKVSQVEIYFLGSSISIRAHTLPQDRKFSRYGASRMDSECMSRGRRKRSIYQIN